MQSCSSPTTPSLSSTDEEELASKTTTTPSSSNEFPINSVESSERYGVTFSEEDIERGVKQWLHSLIGHTTGKPPLNGPLLAAVKNLWKPRGTMELFTLEDDFFLFKFSHLEDYDSVWSREPWYILGKPFILQKFSIYFRPLREEFGSIPHWAKKKLPDPTLCCGSLLDHPLPAVDHPAAIKTASHSCASCGSSQLLKKNPGGGGISTKGKRIILRVQDLKDLSRDVIKSDSACVEIPEIELELGRLNGLVTTVKGLVTKISENRKSEYKCMFVGSLREMLKKKWLESDYKLKKLLDLEEPWTLILDDALACSFVAPVTDAIEEDKQLNVEEYERTWAQNEELGLNATTSTGRRKKKGKKKKKKKKLPLQLRYH